MAFKRVVAMTLVAALVWSAGTRDSFALLAPAQTLTPSVTVERHQDLKTIQTFLDRGEVQQRLSGFGLNDDEIQTRLQQMSDQELHQVATQINQQNPAGDGGGLIITILLIGILALLFVYLLKRV